jgi:hypothetical protein
MSKEISNKLLEVRGWRILRQIEGNDPNRLKRAEQEASDKTKYEAYMIVPTKDLCFEDTLMTDLRLVEGYLVYVKPTKEYLRRLKAKEENPSVFLHVEDIHFGDKATIIKEYPSQR